MVSKYRIFSELAKISERFENSFVPGRCWHLTCLSYGGVVSEPEEEFAMRSRWTQLAMSAAAVALLVSGASAQQSNTDDGKRKIKTKTSPTYPELARRMNVSGKVKIEVIITPDGHVRSSRVIGGHPLLVQSCQDAVKEWKFLPAPEETTQVIEFDFRGSN
jgi:TonB family protein